MSKMKKAWNKLLTEGPKGVFLAINKIRVAKKEEKKFLEKKKEYHIQTEEEIKKQRITVFDNPETFSIITPLYNTPESYLLDLIESVKKQTYGMWELCLADGSDSDHSYVGMICREAAEKDPRIIYHILEANKGISENTNECISISSGTYFGLLDHDDILHESALFEMMQEIQNSQADFLYSDEVKFTDKIENAADFNFKPDFGKDELRSHNYICHFTVFSRTLLEKVGQAYRSEFDGSQDHDMVLRLTERANCIVHIPKILYYWRVHENSVAGNLNSKIYAVDAAIRAIGEQLKRTGEEGVVKSNLPYQTIYRIQYEIVEKPLITIVFCNVLENMLLVDLEKKIREKTNYQQLEFIMHADWNRAYEQAKGKYIIVFDAQCIPLNSDWVEELLMYAQRKDVLAVGAKILFGDNKICFAGLALDKESDRKIRFICQGLSDEEQGYEAMLRHVRNTTAIWRGCMMIEKQKIGKLGGFSKNLKEYEDVDICLKGIEAGYINVWTCFARIQYTAKPENIYYCKENTMKFNEAWKSRILERDGFCHPVLKSLELI